MDKVLNQEHFSQNGHDDADDNDDDDDDSQTHYEFKPICYRM